MSEDEKYSPIYNRQGRRNVNALPDPEFKNGVRAAIQAVENVRLFAQTEEAAGQLQELHRLLVKLYDMPGTPESRLFALNRIMLERDRQEVKWGPQHHDRARWYSILGEENGEVAEAINENNKGKGMYDNEVTHVAAVATNMLEDWYKQG